MNPLAQVAIAAAWDEYDAAEAASWRLYALAPSAFSGRIYVRAERRAREAMMRAVEKVRRIDSHRVAA